MSAQTKTQKAIFEEIQQQVHALTSVTGQVAVKAAALRDLALAYRYAAGGSQPVSVSVETK